MGVAECRSLTAVVHGEKHETAERLLLTSNASINERWPFRNCKRAGKICPRMAWVQSPLVHSEGAKRVTAPPSHFEMQPLKVRPTSDETGPPRACVQAGPGSPGDAPSVIRASFERQHCSVCSTSLSCSFKSVQLRPDDGFLVGACRETHPLRLGRSAPHEIISSMADPHRLTGYCTFEGLRSAISHASSALVRIFGHKESLVILPRIANQHDSENLASSNRSSVRVCYVQ
ncbi:hypothetical protein N657DRAFT_21140 [Parathielavia appendiculata]|uniref:Uncharacterized protein n=1 Tax=Parathielavia appendiculata TaxID=2587402 RepID=A0AAN6U8M2_9PEZI|nr:hypothetical protein N657DRAFT_21140 [Parathielavia appendiculata]